MHAARCRKRRAREQALVRREETVRLGVVQGKVDGDADEHHGDCLKLAPAETNRLGQQVSAPRASLKLAEAMALGQRLDSGGLLKRSHAKRRKHTFTQNNTKKMWTITWGPGRGRRGDGGVGGGEWGKGCGMCVYGREVVEGRRSPCLLPPCCCCY